MADRRSVILDAALRVIAEQGMRALTHRAVDAAAGLPGGSTSYYFRSRAALLTGCVAWLLQLDLEQDLPIPEGAGTSSTPSPACSSSSACGWPPWNGTARSPGTSWAWPDPGTRPCGSSWCAAAT